MTELHRKYGVVVRTAPDEVSVADLSAIRTIYGPGSKFRKSDWYSVWQGSQKTDLFAERDIQTHANLKRKISRIYAMSSLTPLEKWIDDAVDCFMDQMGKRGTDVVDLGTWLQLLAFDVIGEVSFSRRFGFLEAGEDDGTLIKIELALKSLASVGQMPWLFWLDSFLKPLLGSRLNLKLRHGLIRKYAAQEVDARRTRPTDHDDILGASFRVQEEKGSSELSDEAITSIATANVFAGSDTTAISLRAICHFLLTNPASLTRLRKETDERKTDGRLSWPATFKQVSDWPFLQAIISEALRLHPAVGLSLPRVVPPGGIMIAGRFIPEGSTVGVNAWVVHHDPSVFGHDHDIFKPERWLEKDKGDMERYFFAFGGGQRLCIGKNISMIEMSKLIPYFFDRFDVSLVEPEKDLEEDCQWFVKQTGLYVRIQGRREKDRSYW
ncbi:Cytochrome P450-like protein 22 [Elsinoe fawcettii]|nr:Cytochrome P450-like protein 22 [Elsinoe fawcettii]